ncbi:hypothetical protein [Azospirillum sp.]|uniref:hypothetical protein n=1 Tax=Azospirillum sp. TaxID=34012 RepID=UPI002D47A84D|nr:hypothetical protein [Azospirillum sp.]HYD66051.1 hypothetical protein [Azospirillum sp.]
MTGTPTMSLRVPQDTEMRRALREAAKALRLGQITATALLDWLASRQTAQDGFDLRLLATEQRIALLEAAVERIAVECGVRTPLPMAGIGDRAASHDRRRARRSK